MVSTIILGFLGFGVIGHLMVHSFIGRSILMSLRIVKGAIKMDYYILKKTFIYIKKSNQKLQKSIKSTKQRKATQKLAKASGDSSNIIPFPTRK